LYVSFLATVWSTPSTPRPEYGGLREVVSRGCFAEALEAGDTVLTINHQAAATLATCRDGMLALRETHEGLQATAWVAADVAGRALFAAIKAGRCLGGSFLFGLDDAVIVRGYDHLLGPVARLEKVRRLVDVSLCFGDRLPAYRATAGRIVAYAH
jgi:HK97 family phage prohead protease